MLDEMSNINAFFFFSGFVEHAYEITIGLEPMIRIFFMPVRLGI